MRVSKDRLRKLEERAGVSDADYLLMGAVASGLVFARLYDVNRLGKDGGPWEVVRLIDGEAKDEIPETVERGMLIALDDDVESARRLGLGL